MICEQCADDVEFHRTGLCIHCREEKIGELREQIAELECYE
jgi:nitrate reductase NapAB chaperone NapD